MPSANFIEIESDPREPANLRFSAGRHKAGGGRSLRAPIGERRREAEPGDANDRRRSRADAFPVGTSLCDFCHFSREARSLPCGRLVCE